jgi:hypothetical protein
MINISIFSFVSCKKDDLPMASPRKIRFVLYTEEDFSSDSSNITFSLFIRNSTKTLFDSTLSTIRIKDIPNESNKLIFEKQVPNDDGSVITAGFYYIIENVGQSWFLDTCSASTSIKTINYSFK